MQKNIIGMSIEELTEYRSEIIKKYIGEFKKPHWYFDKLTDIDILIKNKTNTIMQTETNNKPLYKVLNEKRTQGNLMIDIIEQDGEIHLIPKGKHMVFCSIYALPLDEVDRANAQYTALAVNNFSVLADALEHFVNISQQRQDLHSPYEAATFKKAKEALKKIS